MLFSGPFYAYVTYHSRNRLWIRDRHTAPEEFPEANSTKFKNALKRNHEKCLILKKREIEFYYPENIHIKAQNGDKNKEKAVLEILKGDQSESFDNLAKKSNCESRLP